MDIKPTSAGFDDNRIHEKKDCIKKISRKKPKANRIISKSPNVCRDQSREQTMVKTDQNKTTSNQTKTTSNQTKTISDQTRTTSEQAKTIADDKKITVDQTKITVDRSKKIKHKLRTTKVTLNTNKYCAGTVVKDEPKNLKYQSKMTNDQPKENNSIEDYSNYFKDQLNLQSESFQPKKLKSERFQTGKLQPENLQPEKLQPEKLQPEKFKSKRLQPENLQPERLQPEKLQLEILQPENLQQENLKAEILQPENLQLDRLQPEHLQPEKLQPEKLQPKRLQPENLQAEKLQPEKLQPKILQPDTHGPEIIHPEILQPEILQPETLHPEKLPPEPQTGNIEYKLKIVNPSQHRFEHLVTQMKWRLREGHGEAIYEIGIEDDGTLAGLTRFDLQNTLTTLRKMALKLEASVNILSEKLLDNGRKVAEILVRKIPDDRDNIEIRVALLGNAGAGKSTLLGVLTQGELDNGKGRARLNMFRHLHEIQSGRTSCISHEILGFSSQGEPINYSWGEFMTAEVICESSSKLVTFLDLAGSKKYISTTVQGISGYSPNYAMVVVSSNAGIAGMTREHVTLAIAHKIPFFLVVTKVDVSPPEDTVKVLKGFLKEIGIRKVPMVISTMDDVVTAGRLQHLGDVVPILCVSNVTGDGLELLLKFLHILPPRISVKEKKSFDQEPVEFQVDENCIAGENGLVLGGLLVKGVLMEGTDVQIGPQEDGMFLRARIKSLHRNKVACRVVRSGQSAAVCLDEDLDNLRNGMVLLGSDVQACGSLYFQANVSLLFPSTGLYVGSETTAHINSIRQTVVVLGIFEKKFVHSEESASVFFKFKKHPEYVYVGQRLLLRDGLSRGIGEIIQVFPLSCLEES